MNSKQIHDLTVRLAKALDQNYDVIHMDDVISVISTLEGTKITKEQLEATRLAKYINHLRRRTKSEHLARRAKSLLKKWREMVGIQQQQQNNDLPNVPINAVSIPTNYNVNMNPDKRLRAQSISPAGISTNFDALNLHHSNSNSSQNIGVVVSTYTPIDVMRPVSQQNTPSIGLGSDSKCIKFANQENVCKRIELPEGGQHGTESALSPASLNKKQPISFQNLLSGLCDTIHGEDVSYNKSATPIQRKNIAPNHAFIADHSSNSNSEMGCNLANKSLNIPPIVIDIQDSNSGSNLTIPATKTVNSIITMPISKIIVTKNAACNSPTSLYSKPKRTRKDKKRKDCEISVQNNNTVSILNPKVVIEESSNQQRNLNLSENDDKSALLINDDKSRLTFPTNISEILSLSNSSMDFPSDDLLHTADEQDKKIVSIQNKDATPLKVPVYDLTFSGKFKQSSSLVPASSDSGEYITSNFSRHNTSSNLTSSNNFSLPVGAIAPKFVPFRDNGSISNDSNSNSRISHFDFVDVGHVKTLQDIRAQKRRDTLPLQKPMAGETALIQTPIIPSLTPLSHKFLQTGEVTESVQTSNSFPEKRFPRKRGRKKGSKGIDSVISKETSLTSHMLMTSLCSGGKKVKTTKELYTEMQNRKLGGVTASSSPTLTNWHSQQVFSRPTSSCSDEGDSDSDTATSEPSRDSATTQKHVKRSISIDSASNSQLISIKVDEYHNSGSAPSYTAINVVEKQLFDFVKELPPLLSINSIELKCTEELVPCTCKINEIILERNNGMQSNEDTIESQFKKENNPILIGRAMNKHQKSLLIEEQPSQGHGSEPIKLVCIASRDFESDVASKIKWETPKPKKSIFDLDFDDDDDPLHTIKAEAAAANVIQHLSILPTDNSVILMNDAIPSITSVETTGCTVTDELPLGILLDEPLMTSEVKQIGVLPIFEVIEDLNCVAKQRYEIQTQKITKFHIKSLHNYFIPNVNGNWDNSNNVRISTIKNSPSTSETSCADGYDVVPKYGSLIFENIKKDLSHITFGKTTLPHTTCSSNFKHMPFLGMARTFERLCNRNQKHLHRKCHKTVNKSKSISDDPCLSCKPNLSIVTNSNNRYKFNKSSFKNITIDIAEPCINDAFALQGSVITKTTGQVEQNLLAIADKINYTPTKSLSDYTREELNETEMDITKNTSDRKHPTKYKRHISITQSTENIDKTKVSESIDRNISSRRSSTCSNSSLNQTQDSINLKLKRKFQEQKELRPKYKFKKCNRHNYEMNIDDNDNKKCCHKLRIKRIKIAINGDVATQMQISRGSSSNSSDESNDGNREEVLTRDSDTINDNYSKVKHKADGYVETDENEDIESENSDGRKISTCKSESTDLCSIDADAETGEKERDAREIDFENYVDPDVDLDEYFEDVSVYHEVVTRDIAAPSTGNNHIVLTIKKTPSKTNSPSNSLSGMSPLIINKNNSVANLLNATPLIPLKTNKNATDIDMNEVIVKKLDIEEHGEAIDVSEGENIKYTISSEPPVEIILDSDPETKQNNGINSTTRPDESYEQLDSVFCSLSPSEFLSRAATYQLKRRFYRRKRKSQMSKLTANNTVTNVAKKIHRKLFFPHELYVRDYNGANQAILNIASCSSSCYEESGDEFDSTFISEQYEDRDVKVFEKIQDGSLEQFKTTITSNITSNKFEGTTSRCKSRSSSTSSICSASSGDTSSKLNTDAVHDIASRFSLLKEPNKLLDTISNEIKRAIEAIDNDGNDYDKSKIKNECGVDKINVDDELSNENNGLLHSFNNIYCTTNQNTIVIDTDYDSDGQVINLHNSTLDIDVVEIKQEQQQQQLPNKNCDEYNNIYNTATNNINLIKYVSNVSRLETHINCRQSDNSSKRDLQQEPECDYKQNDMNDNYNYLNVNDGARNLLLNMEEGIGNVNCARYENERAFTELMTTQSRESNLLPHKEYRTGLRAVDEDVNDEDGNNCARIQQFKEWHQVLQLRSYNDELLTVLPYVVLE